MTGTTDERANGSLAAPMSPERGEEAQAQRELFGHHAGNGCVAAPMSPERGEEAQAQRELFDHHAR